ncbi:uncharacterized protein LOC143490934 [Brachyhypopomus gauderio]|uniref:uncharacterized protein LOC143490934 n=1 Tax=Brachyhypopomus gauderio TaxID=698409 RepID=UPI004042982B
MTTLVQATLQTAVTTLPNIIASIQKTTIQIGNSSESTPQTSVTVSIPQKMTSITASAYTPQLKKTTTMLTSTPQTQFLNTSTEALTSIQDNLTTSSSSLVVSAASTSETFGSAVINTRLEIKFSSPLPSKCSVLSAVKRLLKSQQTNFTDSVKMLNVTYEKISDTSYAVIFTFGLSNISMPNSTELRNFTYSKLQSSINNALNTLVNQPEAEPLEPQSCNFMSSGHDIKGIMEYFFQNGDIRAPVSYLNELQRQRGMQM